MSQLQLTCLGDFQVTLAGAPLTAFQTDKMRALLIYLALTGQPHQRSDLTRFLWAGYPEASARNSFRQYLHQLRQLLRDSENAPPWLLVTRQTVQFNPAAPLDLDVDHFTRLLTETSAHPHAQLRTCQPCLVRLRAAVDLYRGDFLAGFTIADSDPFEEWRRITQEQLHLQVLAAFTQLADAAEAAGDGEQALQDTHRQLALEPWLETAHRRVMRILGSRGQRAAAIAQYNNCRHVLAEELGAAPEAETTALCEQIRVGRFDKVTKQQNNKVTGVYQMTPSPNHSPPPLFGRSTELTHLATLLTQPSPRLVTLVGPPGVGKTRLAQASVESGTPHRFVELATITDPTLVATTIVQALGFSISAEQSAVDELIEGLRDKTLVLVLDNFEQVLAAGPLVLRPLLLHCPRLKLLVTSRVALHLQEEQVVPVDPLPLPDLTQLVTMQNVRDNPAVQFFCQQAARVQPTFQLTDTLAPVIAEICSRLDGLPLALELAAARTRLLSPPMLLARLTNALHLHLLIGGPHNLPARQQTFRTALAWSYDLLDATEQSTFRQLAIFVGGCTLDAAEAVIGNWHVARGDQTIASPQSSLSILDSIDSLLDKNLLRQQSAAGGEPRFILLETIREYAWELLAAQEPQAHDALLATRQRHAAFFTALVEEAATKLVGATQVVWLNRLEAEYDNLRTGLDWLEQSGEISQALRLATQLRYFWRVRGHYRVGTERLLRLLAYPAAATADAVRAQALNATGYLQWVQGDIHAAHTHLAEALTIGRASQEPSVTAFAQRYLGSIAAVQADQATAHACFQESLDLYRSLDNPNEIALALMYLGDAALAQRDKPRAQQLYQESAALLRQLDNKIVLPYALRHLGYLALWQGNYAVTAQLYTESLTLNLAVGERQGSAAALVAFAALAAAQAQWVRAARLLCIADSWLTANHSQLLPFDRACHADTKTRLQAHLSPSALATEQAVAQAMTRDEVLPYARQVSASDQEGAGAREPEEQEPLSPYHLVPPSSFHPAILSTPAHNLPVAPTPFVGRTRDLADILSRLQTVRLLTLVGPGGMGKTRLALEAGRQQLSTYSDGVWFVALAALTSPTAIASAIVTALGATVQGGEPRTILGQLLQQKHLLLILDNFEHLLAGSTEGVALIIELLQNAPQVRFLVTSRERLNVRGEQLYHVPALAYALDGSLEAALVSPSVRLFAQSVQQVQFDFAVNMANVGAVLRICQLVQGMPLGLELAAASVGVLSLNEIAAELAQSAEILRAEWADLPARQRSMRRVFAWSWQLLSEDEQRALRQIAIFRGGFTRYAAQSVAGATLPILTQLIHKSLLQWQESAEGDGRYVMHELLHQFAAEELEAAGERTIVEEQHGRYYLQFVAERGVRLARSEPKQASREIQLELDNVRQAWAWATRQRCLEPLDQSAYALWQFYTFSGLRVEGSQLFQLTAEAIRRQAQPPANIEWNAHLSQRLLSKLLAIHSSFLIALSKHEQALALAQQATQLGQSYGSIEGEMLGILGQGQALRRMGHSAAAQPLLEQAAQLARNGQPGEDFLEWLPEVEMRAYGWLCSIALTQDDYTAARRYAEQRLNVCQRLGKLHGEMAGLTDLMEIAQAMGDLLMARRYAEAAYQLAHQLGNRWGEAACQQTLGELLCALGKYAQAEIQTRQSLTSYRQIGDPLGEVATLLQLGRLCTLLGKYAAAQTWFDQYTRMLQAAGMPARETFWGLLALALHAHATGNHVQALVMAEQGWQQAQQLDGRANQAYALTVLGLAHESLLQLPEAATAYTQALAFYEVLGHVHSTVEPRAGLAQIALAQGDWVSAQRQVEALLPALATSNVRAPRTGFNSIYFAYWIGYQVRAATHDPRAATLLQQGHDLLSQDAATLDEEDRRHFFEVPPHRKLLAAYGALHMQQRRQVTSVTERVPTEREVALHNWDEMLAVEQLQERSTEFTQLAEWLSL